MIELYHDWDSVCSFKVRMCLSEKGAAWTSRRVDLLRFENLQPAYLALNPNGVVPTLVDDGRVVIESSVINEYLDETAGRPRLTPDDPHARALMRILVKVQDDVLYFAQRPATFQLMVKRMLAKLSRDELDALVRGHPQPQRAEHFLTWAASGPVDAKVVDEAREKVGGVLARLETALGRSGGPWLVGGGYTLADVAYAPFVHRLGRLRFEDLWADKPLVAAWMDRLRARPAFAEAIGPAEHLMAAPEGPWTGQAAE